MTLNSDTLRACGPGRWRVGCPGGIHHEVRISKQPHIRVKQLLAVHAPSVSRQTLDGWQIALISTDRWLDVPTPVHFGSRVRTLTRRTIVSTPTGASSVLITGPERANSMAVVRVLCRSPWPSHRAREYHLAVFGTRHDSCYQPTTTPTRAHKASLICRSTHRLHWLLE